MIPPFEFYLFDVDGTLVDSALDICGAIQGVLASAAKPDIPDEFLRSYIGRHLVDLFTDLFPACPAEEMERMVQQYRSSYSARNHASTRIYRSVPETLAQLSGKKSTATTKGTPTTRTVLEMFGLLPYFDHVQGTDGFPAKPAPDVIFKALEEMGGTPDQCLFVGDSAADMEAAKRAGVRSCAVTYGYGKRQDLARWSPDYWIDDLSQLLSNVSMPASVKIEQPVPDSVPVILRAD